MRNARTLSPPDCYGMDAPKAQVLEAIGKLDYPVAPPDDAFA